MTTIDTIEPSAEKEIAVPKPPFPPNNSKKLVIILLSFLIVVMLGTSYFIFGTRQTSPQIGQIIPFLTLQPTSTPTTKNELLTQQPTNQKDLSSFTTLRLNLAVVSAQNAESIYFDDDGSIHSSGQIIGKISNYDKSMGAMGADWFHVGSTLINGKLYTGFSSENNLYIGYVSADSSKLVIVPKEILHDQYNGVGGFVLSPNSNLIAAVSGGGGSCETGKGCDTRAAILFFTPQLTNLQSPYWENSKTKPPQMKLGDQPFSELGATLGILNWNSQSNAIYVSWTLWELGPPPLKGLAKISLDGTFQDMGLPQNLTPVAVSKDEQYILGTPGNLVLNYQPVLYNRTTGALTNLPYQNLVNSLRQKLGSANGPGRHDIVGTSYFSDDNQSVYYSIQMDYGNLQTKTYSYHVFLSDPTTAIEVSQ